MGFLTLSLNNAFKNCYLPSEKLLKEKFQEHFNCKIEILEKNDDNLKIKLLMEDYQPTYSFVLGKSIDKLSYIANVVKIED